MRRVFRSRQLAQVRKLGDEGGQAVVIVALAMVVFVTMLGFVIDVGRLYVTQRQLQTAADAAALAGAQQLPDGSSATTFATAYGADPASGSNPMGLNAVSGLDADNVTTTTKLECLTKASAGAGCVVGAAGSGCEGILPPSGSATQMGCNAIKVAAKASVGMTFLNVIGISSWGVSASSTASLAGGALQPLDIEVVADATASMAQSCSSTVVGISGTPSKLDCAKAGIRALLGTLSPCDQSLSSCGPAVSGNDVASPLDRVGLMVLPGLDATKVTNTPTGVPIETDCAANLQGGTGSGSQVTYSNSALYQVVPFSSDYRTSDTSTALNPASKLVNAIYWNQPGCSSSKPYGIEDPGGVGTYYADAITAAQTALTTDGRPDAQKVIILLSDGDANRNIHGPTPCGDGLRAAEAAETAGTSVFAIAYNASSSSTGSCASDTSPHPSALCVMHEIADNAITDPPSGTDCVNNASDASQKFFNQPADGDLTSIFTQIGASLATTRLVSNNAV